MSAPTLRRPRQLLVRFDSGGKLHALVALEDPNALCGATVLPLVAVPKPFPTPGVCPECDVLTRDES